MERIIYCDMDGVVADFNAEPNAVARFREEKNFFYNLKPIMVNVKAVEILASNYKVCILSASPNARADKDKIKWLKNICRSLKKKTLLYVETATKSVIL